MGYIGDAFGLYWGYGYSPKETWNLAYSRLEGTVVSVEPLIRFHVWIFFGQVWMSVMKSSTFGCF